MKRVLLAGALGGIAAFLWGAVSWTTLHWHFATMGALRSDAPVVRSLQEEGGAGTVYMIPAAPELRGDTSSEARERWKDALAAGPAAYVVYDPAGRDARSLLPCLVGLLIAVACASLAAGLLALAADSLRGYASRVVFVTCLGVAAGLVGPISEWNWLHYPLPFCAVNAADHVAAFLVMGLVVSAMVRPRRA